MIVKTDKAAFWQQHQQNWLDSGLSQKTYCQQHNLSYHVFMYWRVRQKYTANEETALPSVVPVHIEQRARLDHDARHAPAIEIHFGSAKVLLSPLMPAQYVGDLVRSLA
jgi:hypothetical protein